MAFTAGYLAEHPLPPGIVGALGLGGYQLLADVGGVGAGRLGPQAFLLVAPDPDPALPDAGTQIVLHHTRADDRAAAAYVALAAELGYRRLSGWRLALERHGLRSKARLVDPATGGVSLVIEDRHPRGGLFSRGFDQTASGLVARLRALPAPGPPPDLADPELMRGVLLALALRDDTLGGAEAAELADRALTLMTTSGPDGGQRTLDPPAALEAARAQG
ncbi:MAG TPA: hypothetical protein VKV21_04190 [Solirubrobacteraceae bacterium]|nr:hypothetical protein [Solirubrobacteraceae bacterium]